jgi:hypothetical protein
VELYRLRKLWAEQAFWDFARHRPDLVHAALTALVTAEQTPIGREEANQVFTQLHIGFGMRDDDTRNVRTPVELVTLDGEPVTV